jgi:integrase
MGLGPLSAVSLLQARERARECREHLAAGRDPKVERERAAAVGVPAAAARDTRFDAVSDQYLSEFLPHFRNPKHRQQWENTIATYASPVIGRLPVSEITIEDVHRVVAPLWVKKNETAGRLRGRIERILDWATVKGLRKGDNPARFTGALEHLLPKVASSDAHHAAMPFAALPGFMQELGAGGSISSLALEFTILTAARTGETLGATWAEINWSEGLWTVPADRMKARREHVVPLSPAALQVLRTARAFRRSDAPDAYIFPGAKQGRPLSQMSMLMCMRRLGQGHLTVHGFRSAFRDWVAEKTDFPGEIAEMALAHTIPNQVERAYRRGNLLEKRRDLMNAWAGYCCSH